MSAAALKNRTLREMQGAPLAPAASQGDAEPSVLVEKRTRPRDPSDRRGPLRPERLAPSRARVTGRALSVVFRLADIAVASATTVAVLELSRPPIGAIPISTAAPYVAGVITLIVSLFALNAYAFRPREMLASHLARVTAALALAGIAILAVFAPMAGASRLAPWLAMTFAALYVSHLAAWLIVRGLRKGGKLIPNIVIVGGGKNAQAMIEAALARGDVAILGIFDDRAGRGPGAIRGVPVLGDTSALIGHKVMPFVDKVVIAVPSAAQARVRELIERLQVLPNPITLYVDIEGDVRGESIARVADTPLAYMSGGPNDELRAALKRGQDLVIGFLALFIALPIMGVIALAVRLDSPGPVFFRQRRHGFNNEEIVVWKFRSMRTEVSDANARRQVEADDERVTRVGRILRRLSLDELPQILNVLRGEMSLVGPRPHAIGMMTGDTESARLVSEYAHRHRMKPGITGWAAIKGSRGPVDTPASVRRRIALDIEYVERQSFWLDLYIIVMTIPCLFGDDEAVR